MEHPLDNKRMPLAQPKYRIAKPDPLNWTIEEWQEGGRSIKKGPHTGEPTKALWKPAKSFYPTLRLAALALIDKAAGDALLTGEAQSILDALKIAETRVQETLAAMESQRPDVSCDPDCARRKVSAAECDCSRSKV